jgi:hypothetical protein
MAWTFPALEVKFRNILIKYGQNAYLRRRCITCRQSTPNADYSDNCPVCHGKGYSQTVEHYTMRKQVIGSVNSFPSGMGMTDVGPKLDEGTYFFCEPEVGPRYGDLIYDWNNATLEFDVYEISKVLERRYDNRVLFYTCATEIREALKHND